MRYARRPIDAPSETLWTAIAEAFRTLQVLRANAPPIRQNSIATKTPAELFYEAMTKRIDIQIHAADRYDARASSWAGLAALVASISATTLVAEHGLLHRWSTVFIASGTLCLFLVVIWTVSVYRGSNISVGPTQGDFYAIISDTSFEINDVHLLVAEFIATQSLIINERLLGRKAFFMTLAITFFVLEFACYGIAAAIPLIHMR